MKAPLQRVMRETTSREFVEWQLFLQEEVNNPTLDQMYLAQIAQEVYLSVRNDEARKRSPIKSFFLKFVFGKTEEKTPEEIQKERAEASEKFWNARLGGFTPGLKGKKRLPPNFPPKKA